MRRAPRGQTRVAGAACAHQAGWAARGGTDTASDFQGEVAGALGVSTASPGRRSEREWSRPRSRSRSRSRSRREAGGLGPKASDTWTLVKPGGRCHRAQSKSGYRARRPSVHGSQRLGRHGKEPGLPRRVCAGRPGLGLPALPGRAPHAATGPGLGEWGAAAGPATAQAAPAPCAKGPRDTPSPFPSWSPASMARQNTWSPEMGAEPAGTPHGWR